MIIKIFSLHLHLRHLPVNCSAWMNNDRNIDQSPVSYTCQRFEGARLFGIILVAPDLAAGYGRLGDDEADGAPAVGYVGRPRIDSVRYERQHLSIGHASFRAVAAGVARLRSSRIRDHGNAEIACPDWRNDIACDHDARRRRLYRRASKQPPPQRAIPRGAARFQVAQRDRKSPGFRSVAWRTDVASGVRPSGNIVQRAIWRPVRPQPPPRPRERTRLRDRS